MSGGELWVLPGGLLVHIGNLLDLWLPVQGACPQQASSHSFVQISSYWNWSVLRPLGKDWLMLKEDIQGFEVRCYCGKERREREEKGPWSPVAGPKCFLAGLPCYSEDKGLTRISRKS